MSFPAQAFRDSPDTPTAGRRFQIELEARQRMIRIKQGLDLPIAGEPVPNIEDGPPVARVALVADDYIGMKPTMAVVEGDIVKQGQLLFSDKKTSGVRYTSPGSGTVTAINRGAKRKFQSIVIDLDGDAAETFQNYADTDLTGLTREQVRDNLVESGLWTAFRTRPFSRVPALDAVPHAIFVSAIDTNPLAVNPATVIEEAQSDFIFGLQVVRHLTEGKLYLCQAAGSQIPGSELDSVTVEQFGGPHPAGLPGTHIHYLAPVSDKRTVWHVNYQDVIAIGRLFTTGQLSCERVISLAGPAIKNPRVIRTRMGAATADLTASQLDEGECRVISGSVLSGRKAVDEFAFLGRFHLQVSALHEGRERVFFGWQRPGFDKFSVKRVFAGAFMAGSKKFALTTSQEGSRRAMVPIGMYEQVMPLDVVPTFMLRSLITGDTEQAQDLGVLELDEEDLALCTYVCPGKHEYGPMLRQMLTQIELEG